MRPIGPAPTDEHVLAEDRERERGVDRVAERVEDRGDVLVDARPVVPDVGHRQDDVLGEGAVALDAEPDRCWRTGAGARPGSGGTARTTTWPSPLTMSPGREVVDVAADLDDLADELVADDRAAAVIVLCRPRRPTTSMCRSVPQMPVLRTRMRTSLMPDRGLRDVARLRPGPAAVLTSASMGGSASRGRRAAVSACRARVLGPVDDRVLDRADALDLAAHAVARLEEHRRVAEHADARRRAGGDEVARLERDGREMNS